MRELTTEAKVGLLVIVIIGALIWATQRIGDQPSGGSEGNVYYATFDSAAGLTKSTTVEIAGVPVGEIEEITREGNRAKVKMRVRQDVSLPLDSHVAIKGKGILGDKAISLLPGAATEGGTLRNNDEIPTAAAEADFDAIIKRVDAIAQDVQAITGSLRSAIGTAEGQAKLQGMVDDLSEFADNLAQVSTDNREALNEIVENMRSMSERLNQVIDNSGEDLDETFVEIKKAAVKLDSSLTSIDSVAAKIDRGEGTIGRLINDDETVEGLNEAIGGVNDIIERVNRIHIFVNYQGEFQVAREDERAGVMKNQFLFRIQPHADYGYIVGVADDPNGLSSRTKRTYYTDPDAEGPLPVEKRTVETVKRTDAFLLTAQIYKRYGPVGGRIGLKDSSGGVGADLWLLRDDKLKLSFDAYQFTREKKGDLIEVRDVDEVADRDENPRLKVTARYDPVKHIYVVGGVDDAISNFERRAFFAGAGFEFNDDDLKFLMGSLPVP